MSEAARQRTPAGSAGPSPRTAGEFARHGGPAGAGGPPALTVAEFAPADPTATGRADSQLPLGPLRREHRERVREIVEAAGVFRASEVQVALDVFDDALRPGQEDYYLVGAFGRDGLLLGYACYGPTPGAVETWDLYWIAVDPGAQGRGVGRALWDAVETALRERKARLCVIETSSRSDYGGTHRFYERCGMRLVARIPDFYDDGGDDRVIYLKRFRGRVGSGEGHPG